MLRGESSGRPDDNIESLKKRYVSNRIFNEKLFALVIHFVLMKCFLWIVFNYMYVAYKAQYYFPIQSLIQTFFLLVLDVSSILMPSQHYHNTGLCKNTTKQNKLLLFRRQFVFLRRCAFFGSKNGLCVRELYFRFCVLLRGMHFMLLSYGMLCSFPWAVGIVCAFAFILSDPAHAVLGR